MAKVIEVKFYAQQGSEELYVSANGKTMYIRQPMQTNERVVWTTATKWSGGYEADTPIKAGITMKVISGNRRKDKVIHFEEVLEAGESGSTSAEKKEFFVHEQLANAAKGYVKEKALRPYDSWAKWLLNDTSKYNYTGYPDNWLHFGTDVLETQHIDTLNILGHTYSVVETAWKHQICGKTWNVVEIKDTKGSVVELCGIAFVA